MTDLVNIEHVSNKQDVMLPS